MLGFKPGAPVLEPLYYAAPPPQQKKLLARSPIDPEKQADRYTFRILLPQDKINVIQKFYHFTLLWINKFFHDFSY